MKNEIEIRECLAPEELSGCVRLQREVFQLPEIEISPVRHLIVTRYAGGFTLGAFDGDYLVGFVLSVLAFSGNEKIFYSHMTAISSDYQNLGIGSRLKWAQRKRALEEGVSYIKWTFQPVKARNAFFNLEKLGAVIRDYEPNFYGMDYGSVENDDARIGVASDRLFAEWGLNNKRVIKLAEGVPSEPPEVESVAIQTLNNWSQLIKNDPSRANSEQRRIRKEFEAAFSSGLVCRRFRRDDEAPEYLLYAD